MNMVFSKQENNGWPKVFLGKGTSPHRHYHWHWEILGSLYQVYCLLYLEKMLWNVHLGCRPLFCTILIWYYCWGCPGQTSFDRREWHDHLNILVFSMHQRIPSSCRSIVCPSGSCVYCHVQQGLPWVFSIQIFSALSEIRKLQLQMIYYI